MLLFPLLHSVPATRSSLLIFRSLNNCLILLIVYLLLSVLPGVSCISFYSLQNAFDPENSRKHCYNVVMLSPSSGLFHYGDNFQQSPGLPVQSIKGLICRQERVLWRSQIVIKYKYPELKNRRKKNGGRDINILSIDSSSDYWIS